MTARPKPFLFTWAGIVIPSSFSPLLSLPLFINKFVIYNKKEEEIDKHRG